jgi:hypothetical protein
VSVHEWSRVGAGTFHDFHSAWITHLKEALNGGLLPEGYYALSERHAGRSIAGILTLQGAGARDLAAMDSVVEDQAVVELMR